MAKVLFEAAARAGTVRAGKAMPQGELRFTLLYKSRRPLLASERKRLSLLFGASGFQLMRMPAGRDPLVLILQFPGVSRTLSTSYLLSAAEWLATELDLAACSPDADPGWVAEDELGRAEPESIGGVVWALCKSHATPPTDSRWSIKAVRADKAWARFDTTGGGIRVGQPDTGVATHREIEEGLDIAAGTDIIAGGGPPTDPLLATMSSPGHGTATSSVVVSRSSGGMVGTAPGAILVPIRCVDGVILTSGVAVAAAIDHARAKKCDIVTMSLGGPFAYPELERAIQRAVDAGMIVLAAAGNCVPFVVYPAWDANVIAVAAVDEHDRKWKGSSSGAKVDISAPGENVFIARRETPDDPGLDLVQPGQGTSFAVTTTAGCAALWLARHTRAKVRAAAKAKGVSVQNLFRAAVRQTARIPADWDAAKMGAGVVDAEALLALNLGDIDIGPVPEAAAHPALAEFGPGFDWTRLGVEAGFLAFDRAHREDPQRIASLETAVIPRASPALAAAARRAGRGGSKLLQAPMVLDTLLTPQITPGRALRTLALTSGGGGVEQGGMPSDTSAKSYLESAAGRTEVMDEFTRIHEALSADAQTENDAEGARLRKQILELAPDILTRYAKGEIQSTAALEGYDRIAAEALIRLVGRPALRLSDGAVKPDDPQIGGWMGDLVMPRLEIKPLVAAVGRIDIEIDGHFAHAGTGIHIEPGVILTNRHVMETFAELLPSPAGRRLFDMTAKASIIFDDAAADEKTRFKITGVFAAGGVRIGKHVDLNKLDMAFLEVETSNGHGSLPKPISPQGMPSADAGVLPKVAVVGYPASPPVTAVKDPTTGRVSEEMIDVLWKIYNTKFGLKYISPGEIMDATGRIAGDDRRWAFSHDCTTLGGNSGSATIGLGGAIGLCGLHFGGRPKWQNFAHDILAARTITNANLSDPSLLGMAWPG